jgi:hypothetical protein
MVDMIVWLTAVAVAGLTLLNLAHGAWLALRVAIEVQERHGHLGRRLWWPVSGSPADLVAWLGTWRRVLRADTRLVACCREGRTVLARHAYLGAAAHLWALAVTAIALTLA